MKAHLPHSTADLAAQLERIFKQTRNFRTFWRLVALCLSCAAPLLLTGCSSFERDWKTAQAYAYPADEVAGCWEGTWKSNKNGHNGKLRAILTKQGENEYLAQFKATYAYVIPFEFEVPLMTSRDGTLYGFQGQADLGRLAGGNYSYGGQASPCDFSATYCAKKDYGVFSMTRHQACVQSYDDCGTGGSCSACQRSGSGCCEVHQDQSAINQPEADSSIRE